MLLFIFGAAIFVSCVCCWGDMMAIRRVNAQVEQNHHMLESLRKKLMQDNYDYETNSAEEEGIGKTTEGALSVRRETGGPSTAFDVTRRFAIVNNSDSTVTVDSVVTSDVYAKEEERKSTMTTTASTMTTTASSMTTTASAMTTTASAMRTSVTAQTVSELPIEFVRELFRPRAQSEESGVGMESLFDDIKHLLNRTENNQKNSSMPVKPTKSLPITLTSPDHGDGKLTLKNIEDLEFKFLRVKEKNGYRRKEGQESIIVTSKDGLFSQIKLPESRRQYMASESETDK